MNGEETTRPVRDAKALQKARLTTPADLKPVPVRDIAGTLNTLLE
jgi:hypothetical protein